MKNREIFLTLISLLKEDSEESTSTTKDIYSDLVGKYVIIRSRNEGVNAGYLEAADSTGCVLKSARRLYRPISKDKNLSWYEGVSISGLDNDSIVSAKTIKKIIVEDYSITFCSEEAKESIEEFKSNETTI